ncbi:MAG: 16S rRNA (uracil(1498)-N(3))-methyltransferase [Thermodesulfobacteriota bacterium]|nr:MAG: 16S rRNA (uracil(1498)-N(3))-methyltransferase [Thermodesulfobacteriota bacterium]
MNKREAFNSNLPLNPNQISTAGPHRIFVSPENISQDRIILRGEPVKKVRLVLRLKPKDSLSVFDGAGYEYLTQIVSISPQTGELKIVEKTYHPDKSPLEIHLGQAVPKSQKMDFIIQKAVELGVGEIHPFFSSRTIPRLTSLQAMKKVERWRKICQGASQQSGRVHIPTVNPLVDFIELLTLPSPGSLKVILQKNPSHDPLKNFLRTNRNKRGIFFLVGPEGGFAPEEITRALNHGFKPISLGERILRTETVALTFLSILQYELGDMT